MNKKEFIDYAIANERTSITMNEIGLSGIINSLVVLAKKENANNIVEQLKQLDEVLKTNFERERSFVDVVDAFIK